MSIRTIGRSPYVIVVFTAILSGFFVISGAYFSAKFQANHAIVQKKFEYQVSAYSSFLASVDMSKSPIIAEFLMVGELSKYVATDGELQTLEDRFEELILLNKKYSISLQLISKFNTLRLHGSSKVRKYCDDIQTVLALRGNYIDWSAYSSEVNNFRDEWLKVQKGNAYGWEEKVSGDERVMFVLISVLYRNLLDQLSGELHSGKT